MPYHHMESLGNNEFNQVGKVPQTKKHFVHLDGRLIGHNPDKWLSFRNGSQGNYEDYSSADNDDH